MLGKRRREVSNVWKPPFSLRLCALTVELFVVRLDGFYIPVVFADVADGFGGGLGSGLGGDDWESAENGFGADFDFVAARYGAARCVD